MLIEKIAISWVTLYTSIAILLMIGIIVIAHKIKEIVKKEL
jgi:hypothetical protein